MSTKVIKDVHTEHCCAIHGCKYGKNEECTVVIKAKKQNYIQSSPCEICETCGFTTVKDMIKSLHPTYGSLENQIIMYAKGQYGKSNSKDFTREECLYKDLRFLIGEWTGCGYDCIGIGDVNNVLVHAFVTCGILTVHRVQAITEMLGWQWGRGNGVLSDREPICVMLGQMSIVKAKWVYMPQKLKGINFKDNFWSKPK